VRHRASVGFRVRVRYMVRAGTVSVRLRFMIHVPLWLISLGL
jgi:hypothetical protein